MERAWNEIPVRVLDMSTVLKPSDAFALVLEEIEGEHRRLALIIGAVEAQGIRIAQLGYRPPRPFTHELMLDVMKQGGLEPVKGVISAVKSGVYYASRCMCWTRCWNGNSCGTSRRTVRLIRFLSTWWTWIR